MLIHEFAIKVTKIEGGAVSVNIAQVKEILKIINHLTNGIFYRLIDFL